MSASIVDANGQKTVVRGADDCAVVEAVVDFPGELCIILEGKNNNIDTIVDDSGKIIQDKFVQLTQVDVDRITLPDHFLQQWPVVNDTFNTSYFGFNGKVRLQFNEPNSFYWLLKTQK
jgi:hypothetical protein